MEQQQVNKSQRRLARPTRWRQQTSKHAGAAVFVLGSTGRGEAVGAAWRLAAYDVEFRVNPCG
jgi:hypothetical protein